MTINETAQFIHDRALSLRYEGTHFRATAEVTLTWLLHASAWAKRNSHMRLAAHLSDQMREIREVLQ